VIVLVVVFNLVLPDIVSAIPFPDLPDLPRLPGWARWLRLAVVIAFVVLVVIGEVEKHHDTDEPDTTADPLVSRERRAESHW
jgi:hypothetical protein